jgi:hypothetical protein
VKPMIRRLRLLEKAFLMSTKVEREDGLAVTLRARRIQRLQREGSCILPGTRPPRRYPFGTSITDILRQRRPQAIFLVARLFTNKHDQG